MVGWPRIRVSCDYRAPLRFGDTVTVRLLVQKIGTRSVTYAFRFLKDGAVVARGEITAVCVKSDGKGGMVSAPLPPRIRSRLQVAPERALRT